MYYIERNEKEVVKYDVKIFERGIEEIRDRLIKDYSSIINIYNYFCFSNVDKLETDNIKNYSNNSLKVNFSYYIYPELVHLIDMLITDNISAIAKIVNYEQPKINSKELFNENYLLFIANDISNKLNIDFDVNDLKSYLKEQKNIYINNDDYMFIKEELLKCISFERIDSININDFYKMMNFLELSSKDIFNDQVASVKKRKRK